MFFFFFIFVCHLKVRILLLLFILGFPLLFSLCSCKAEWTAPLIEALNGLYHFLSQGGVNIGFI